jgi:hypothetical protein
MIIINNSKIKKEILDYHDIKFSSHTKTISNKIKKILNNQEIQHLTCESKSEKVISSCTDSFVYAVHLAYRYHVPLVITPDIIWYLISSAAGIHINLNENQLRDQFVTEEQEKINIIRNDFVIGQSNPWNEVIDEVCMHLKKRTKNDIADKIIADFSTTNDVSKTVSQIVLMNSMSSYFEYGLTTRCGIPEIHIDGTKQDWINLKKNAHSLIGPLTGLNIWLKSLEEIFNNFIDAFDSRKDMIDIDFWNQIYKHTNQSGGSVITGWIITLFPYLAENKKNKYIFSSKKKTWRDTTDPFSGLKTSSFDFKLNCVPFKWNFNNKEIKMNLIGGLIGIDYDESDSKLIPIFGYAVTEDCRQCENDIKSTSIDE